MENFIGEEQERLLNKLTRDILNKMIEKKLQLQVARQMNIANKQDRGRRSIG